MPSPRSLRWPAGVAAVLGVVVALVVISGRPEDDRRPDLEGPCAVRAEIIETGLVIDPAVSSGVYEIPLDGTISYRANIDVPEPEARRPLAGGVDVDLPWPLGRTRVASFDGEGSRVDQEGSTPVDVPWVIAPIGATATVHARYEEPGVQCSGSLTVRLSGNLGDGLPRPFALGAVLLGLLGCVMAARARWRETRDEFGNLTGGHARVGRPGLGAVAGSVLGFGLALMALLWSIVPLESALLTLLPIIGLGGGAALGIGAPIDPRSPADPADNDDLAELVLLD